MQVIERRVQKSDRRFRVAEAALTQQPRDRRLDVQGGAQRQRCRIVTREMLPTRGNRH
jgi:hypothetical protein